MVDITTFGSKEMRVGNGLYTILLLDHLAMPSRVLAVRLVAFSSLVTRWLLRRLKQIYHLSVLRIYLGRVYSSLFLRVRNH